MDIKEHQLNVLQSIIARMANNSSNCKLWCVTLTAGILAFFFQKQTNVTINYLFLLLPLIPFFFLDAYYLGLEKFFRKEYNALLVSTNTTIKEIPTNKWYIQIGQTFQSMGSFSVWGFYLVLGCVTYFILSAAHFS